ncbi:Peptidoglycan-binding lysin domain [Macleaya cordata]|uniref:Peptidoglycan-binding lysin domain n=1 Tax=Macleaya cordata TaxID=56857 RepID=A0A200QDC7_MACCD|nr:Peptidoglycan-binding lysin domain [Macleaya cordata]
MMLAKVESGKKNGGDKRLLHDIEAISQALYLNKNPSKGLVSASDGRSKSAGKTHFPEPKLKPRIIKEDLSQKDKKSSIWNWKPLKALSHIRNRRFNCCFSLEVHSIEGLSLNFDDTSLCVHWKRRDEGLQTGPAKVVQGMAKFEETLMHRCSVTGSGNGPNHSAKYEAKHFLLYVSMVGFPDLDLGKHRIDLTRLLPLTLDELEEEKSSGKWTTSYKLSGKAKGANLNVSFGFMVVGDDSIESRGYRNPPVPLNLKPSTMKTVKGLHLRDGQKSLQRVGSLPGIPNQRSRLTSHSVEDIKILHEVLPSSGLDLSTSVSLPCQKFNEAKVSTSTDSKPEFEVFSDQVDPLKPKSCSLSECMKENSEDDCEVPEFTVIEHGIELSKQDQVTLEESTADAPDDSGAETSEHDDANKGDGVSLGKDMNPIPKHEDYGNFGEEFFLDDISSKENSIITKESIMEELDSAIQSLSIFESAGLESPQCKSDFLGEANYMEFKSNYKASKAGKSLSLDDATDSVASEFLTMLGIEHSPFGLSSDSDPESPRERLLRQFEKDSLAGGSCIFDFDIGKGEEAEFGYDAPTGSGWGDSSEDFELSSVVQAAEAEHYRVKETMGSKTRAKMLEDLETEALMREWGLNEKAFQCSPPNSAGGFGSPIDLPPEELELPPLDEGLGPFVQTKDGGFLRSMNPSLFKNAKNVGNLIMQVSSPVVVPAEMGSGIMDILQGLASVGIEKLSMQANKLMPLEDITGKTMQQVAWEAAPCLEAADRQVLIHHEPDFGQDAPGRRRKGKGGSSGHRFSNMNFSSSNRESGSEYVNLEDLAPLAMDKIEALSIEGLRIQSGMADEEAPSNISPQAIGEISALEGKRANINGSLGLEGAGGLQLLDIKDCGNDVDGLMGLSITLDEWMRLDSGIVDDEEDQISERTSKILAAHHASSTDLFNGGGKGDKKRGKGSGRRCGLLGNNFTVALMVQLRDPLRNYEPVGTPMLALIQVERVFVPPKPKIYVTVSEKRKNEDDDESETVTEEPKDEKVEEKKEEEEEGIPQFKITEVHVAGLKTEPDKKKLWGSTSQQQSGSRWLLASGMGKTKKNPFMKSKAVTKSSAPQVTTTTTTVQPGDTLWSISSRVHGTGAKWKDLAKLNPHIRNPNVIFPNETIRLR